MRRRTHNQNVATRSVTFAGTVLPVVVIGTGLVGIYGPIPAPSSLPIPAAAAWVSIMYAVNSLIALVVYRYDKWASRKGLYRVPEGTLHVVEFLCGWPGALIAIPLFRHKNRKGEFLMVTGLIVLAHAAFWIWLSQRA